MGAMLEDATVTVDLDATPRSGDLVVVLYRQQTIDPNYNGIGETRLIGGRVESHVKQLEATRDGRWWLTCLEGAMPIDCNKVPAALFRVVDVQHDGVGRMGDGAPAEVFTPITKEQLAAWDDHSRDARVEWTLQGKLRGTPFPGIHAVLKSWPESFRLPAAYAFHGVSIIAAHG